MRKAYRISNILTMYRWNFVFPTKTENTVWRIFSLIAVSAPCIIYAVSQMPFLIVWLASKNIKISSLEGYADPRTPFSRLEIFITMGSLLVYMIVRLGTIALMFASLRAVPTGTHTSIQWVECIPHL